ncbi:MAG: hypothetical protein ACFE8G_12340 [Candidatus Hermodarchaeota archaeon]
MKIKVSDIKTSGSRKVVVNVTPKLYLELKQEEDEILEVSNPENNKKEIVSEYIINQKEEKEPNTIEIPLFLRSWLQVELNNIVHIQKLTVKSVEHVIIAGLDKVPSIKFPEELLKGLENCVFIEKQISKKFVCPKYRYNGPEFMILDFLPRTNAGRIQKNTKISLLEFTIQDISKMEDDQEYIKILKDLSGRSTGMKLDMLKNILKLNEDQFIIKIFDWEKQLGYTIKDDYLYFQGNGIRESIDNLEDLFNHWEGTNKKLEFSEKIQTKKNIISISDEKEKYQALDFIKLRILMEKGDHNATEVIKRDLIRRINSNWKGGIVFLIKKGYLKYFDNTELKSIIFDTNFNLTAPMREAMFDTTVSSYRFLAYLRKLCELQDKQAWDFFLFRHFPSFKMMSFDREDFENTIFENYFDSYNRITKISDINGILAKISKRPFKHNQTYEEHFSELNLFYREDLTSDLYEKVKNILLVDDDFQGKFSKCLEFIMHDMAMEMNESSGKYSNKTPYLPVINTNMLLKRADRLILNKEYFKAINMYDKISLILESFSDPYSDGVKRKIEKIKWKIYKSHGINFTEKSPLAKRMEALKKEDDAPRKLQEMIEKENQKEFLEAVKKENYEKYKEFKEFFEKKEKEKLKEINK